MKKLSAAMVRGWSRLGPEMLPFADAASTELPLKRLSRLALFQVSVGMAIVLLNGTLNRVMIVELAVPAWLVSTMISLPILFAPARVLIGHRSDNYRSALGWRRVPYIWMGTLMQWGGLAIMPFALLLLSGDTTGPMWIGHVATALAFLMVGAGLHTAQTAGLALATDLAPEDTRPRVVALLYVMLLAGMGLSALVFGALLENFSQIRLIRVIQGAAVVTLVLNFVAMWKQEPRRHLPSAADTQAQDFRAAWRQFARSTRSGRFLVAVGLGTAAFSMQDILLEPYGGEVLRLSVSATTMLTALLAGGTLVAFALAARLLSRGIDSLALAALGALVGVGAFCAVIFAAPLGSATLFRVGTACIGFGGGLFAVGTLTAAMSLNSGGQSGLALGAWGAVQATAAGLGIALGGLIRDVVGHLAVQGQLGTALTDPSIGYSFVYHLEIAMLFATLVALGPLVKMHSDGIVDRGSKLGFAEFPG